MRTETDLLAEAGIRPGRWTGNEMRTDMVNAADLPALFDYDAASGVLFRKSRGPEWFSDDVRCGKHQSNAWNSRFAGKKFGSADKRGYIWGSLIGRHCVSAHSIVWALHHGKWPDGVVDHIDGDTSNNRITNLRCVPQAVNSKNRKLSKANNSGFSGVSIDKRTGRWRATINVDGVRINLGFYATLEEAASARAKADEAHGFISRGHADENGRGDTQRGGDSSCEMVGEQRSKHLPGMQRQPEEKNRPVSERVAQAGWAGVVLLALLVQGGASV